VYEHFSVVTIDKLWYLKFVHHIHVSHLLESAASSSHYSRCSFRITRL